MKKVPFLLMLLTSSTYGYLCAAEDPLQNVKEDTIETWAGTGAQDATFSAVSISMLGWGVGLAGGIAILASAIHQSTSSSSHDSGCSH